MDEFTQSKTCPKCGEAQPRENFFRDRSSKDGLQTPCKTCKAARRRAVRAMSPDEIAAARDLREAEAQARLDSPNKTCPRCRRVLSKSEFHKNIRTRDGLQPACKDCEAEGQRRYRAKYPDKTRELGKEAMRRRRAADPNRERDYMRAWRAKNGELVKAARQAWHEANYEKARAAANAANARYKQANPEKRREHDLRRRAMKRSAAVLLVDLAAIWEEQRGDCALCGQPIDRSLAWPDPMSASVDHIIPLAKGGSHAPQNLQWVHLVGNLRKGVNLP